MNENIGYYSQQQILSIRRIKNCTTHYQVLCVDKFFTSTELKASWKKLSLEVHPDKNKAPGAEEAMVRVNNAFETLKDPSRKIEYDLLQYEMNKPKEPSQNPNSDKSRNRKNKNKEKDEEDFVSFILMSLIPSSVSTLKILSVIVVSILLIHLYNYENDENTQADYGLADFLGHNTLERLRYFVLSGDIHIIKLANYMDTLDVFNKHQYKLKTSEILEKMLEKWFQKKFSKLTPSVINKNIAKKTLMHVVEACGCPRHISEDIKNQDDSLYTNSIFYILLAISLFVCCNLYRKFK